MAFHAPPTLSHGVLSRVATGVLPPDRAHLSGCDYGSCHWGSQLLTSLILESQRSVRTAPCKAYTTTTVKTDEKFYTLPCWSEFEMGLYPVFWDTTTGRPPTAGDSLTIFFNLAASSLVPDADYGIAFNGGFNQPIMCGGEPRVMTKRERGLKCTPLYTIKINVPAHALTLEFSFTDGEQWDGPYKLKFVIPEKWRNKPTSFFSEGLAKELSLAGACENAIFPDAAFAQTRCVFPAGMIHKGGNYCQLDINPGCTDPDSPFFDPLANIDDGCPYLSDEASDDE